MSILLLDAKALNALQEYAKRPEALDEDFPDCPHCQKEQNHYKETRWRFLPYAVVAPAVFAFNLCNQHRNLGEGIVVGLAVSLAAFLLTTLIVAQLEMRARRKAHLAILQSLRPAARMLRAMTALISRIRGKANSVLDEIMTQRADALVQHAMTAQYALLRLGGYEAERSELLSVISRARELRRQLADYTENADKLLEAQLAQAHDLARDAAQINVGMNDCLGEMAAFAAEAELLAAAAAVFAPTNAWSEKIRALNEDQKLRIGFYSSLNAEPNYAAALDAFERLIAQLPPLPASSAD